MCHAAKPHAEYVGIALHTAYGSRGESALGGEKSERAVSRNGYRSGYPPRRLDARKGTMYLMLPKVRQGGYIPFFVT